MLTNEAGNLANAARRDDVESLDLVTDASEDPSMVRIWRGCVKSSRLDLPNNRALGLAYQQEAGKLNQAAARRVPGSPHADTSVPESGVAATIVTSLLPHSSEAEKTWRRPGYRLIWISPRHRSNHPPWIL